MEHANVFDKYIDSKQFVFHFPDIHIIIKVFFCTQIMMYIVNSFRKNKSLLNTGLEFWVATQINIQEILWKVTKVRIS